MENIARWKIRRKEAVGIKQAGDGEGWSIRLLLKVLRQMKPPRAFYACIFHDVIYFLRYYPLEIYMVDENRIKWLGDRRFLNTKLFINIRCAYFLPSSNHPHILQLHRCALTSLIATKDSLFQFFVTDWLLPKELRFRSTPRAFLFNPENVRKPRVYFVGNLRAWIYRKTEINGNKVANLYFYRSKIVSH